MEPRKHSVQEEGNDQLDHTGLSSANNTIREEETPTRNVAQNIEEGDEDYDDEELTEADFYIDGEEEDEDLDDDDEIV